MTPFAAACIPLPDGATFEDGAGMFVNPLTVISMLNIARAAGSRAIVHTAGGSALGKMLIKAGKRWGIAIIPVVRSAAAVEELQV